MVEEIKFEPIGIIHSPFKEPAGTPIQPPAAGDVEGEVEIYSRYTGGLKDLDGFSHIFLIFYFHLSRWRGLHQKPFMDNTERGVFAIRSPSRPNPIGLSVVRLVRVEKNILHIKGLDILDGTPLLDIKPYVPRMDNYQVTSTGWLRDRVDHLDRTRDDGRFSG